MRDHPERDPTPSELKMWEAEALKSEAEAAKAEAEAECARQMARTHAAAAEANELQLERAREARRSELAGNDRHHVYLFSESVGDQSVAKAITKLTEWHRLEPNCNIEIVFNSPGGGVVPGMALFDFIIQLRSQGHNVTTVALGYAASMAGILLQAGTTRVMHKESWLLLHEGSFGAVGSFGEVIDTVDWVKRIGDRIASIFAHRSHLTKAQIKKRWQRKDWWISSDEGLKLGMCDEVR